MSARSVAAAAGVVLLIASARAAAEPPASTPPATTPAPNADGPPPADVERARAAYLDGEAAYRLGHFGEAAERYEAAYRIMKAPSMLFDIAQAHRRWFDVDRDPEHLRRAVDMYRAFLRDAPAAPQRPLAEKFIAELDKAIASETGRRRGELIARATGREGLALVDRLLGEGDVGGAALALDRILATPGKPRDVLVGALEKRAYVAGTEGKPALALSLIQKALELDPGFLLPPGVESVNREAFDRAAQTMAERPLSVAHVPPGRVRRGEPARVSVTVQYDRVGLVDEVALYYRRVGTAAWLSARAGKPAGAVVLEVPAEYLRAAGRDEVQYYVAAIGQLDTELATQGSAKEPYLFAVEPEVVARPAWRRPALWVGVVAGVLAIGAAATVAAVATQKDEPVLPAWDARAGK